jgi:2'-5' RNA ligase
MRSIPNVKASWTNTDNIHLTLKFLGNVAVDQIQSITDSAAAAANESKIFDLQIGSCGVFPGKSRPKVLWIGIGDPSGGLAGLQQRLEIECAKRGFPKEERVFKPHLTVARLRGGNDTRALVDAHLEAEFPVQTTTVNELIVFRSELSSHGSKYTPLSKHALT